MRRLSLLLLLSSSLAACSTYNRNVSGDWDCQAQPGMPCASISEADGRLGKSKAAPTQGGDAQKSDVSNEATPFRSVASPISPDTTAAPSEHPSIFSKEFWQALGFGPANDDSAAANPPAADTPAGSAITSAPPPSEPKPAPIAPGVNNTLVKTTDGAGQRVSWTDQVRTGERIGRAWFFPYVDASGNLHDGTYVYFVVNKGQWVVE